MADRPVQRYYPQQSDPRLNEDFRLLYDHVYRLQDHVGSLTSRLQKSEAGLAEAHGKLAALSSKSDPGGPSTTKIAGLNVKGIQPSNGNAVANLSGIPTLGYNSASGEIEWYIPA